jgi:hypothetical protein
VIDDLNLGNYKCWMIERNLLLLLIPYGQKFSSLQVFFFANTVDQSCFQKEEKQKGFVKNAQQRLDKRQ